MKIEITDLKANKSIIFNTKLKLISWMSADPKRVGSPLMFEYVKASPYKYNCVDVASCLSKDYKYNMNCVYTYAAKNKNI